MVSAVCESVSKLTIWHNKVVRSGRESFVIEQKGKDKLGKSTACCNKIKISTSQQSNINIVCACSFCSLSS